MLQAAGVRQPLDKVITKKLNFRVNSRRCLFSKGSAHISRAFRALYLFKECTPPNKTNRRFYCTNKDIYNHLYKGKPNHFCSAIRPAINDIDVLTKFGNQMCLLNTTYRTTKYDFPLYFLCVRTDVCYQVVGSFVMQYGNTHFITEALMVFQEWNKD